MPRRLKASCVLPRGDISNASTKAGIVGPPGAKVPSEWHKIYSGLLCFRAQPLDGTPEIGTKAVTVQPNQTAPAAGNALAPQEGHVMDLRNSNWMTEVLVKQQDEHVEFEDGEGVQERLDAMKIKLDAEGNHTHTLDRLRSMNGRSANRRAITHWFMRARTNEAPQEKFYEDVLLKLTTSGQAGSLAEVERLWTEHAIRQPSRLEQGEMSADDYHIQQMLPSQVVDALPDVTENTIHLIKDENHPYSNHNQIWYFEAGEPEAESAPKKTKKKTRGAGRKRAQKKAS
jgi:hypothetical protein